jgi:hypothetical protein
MKPAITALAMVPMPACSGSRLLGQAPGGDLVARKSAPGGGDGRRLLIGRQDGGGAVGFFR